MFNVTIIVEEKKEKEKLLIWMQEEFDEQCLIVEEGKNYPNVAIIEISHLFDWLKISRLKKRNKDCLVIPLLDHSMLSTSPLAFELKLQSLIVKPVKKSIFLRSMKGVLHKQKTNSLNEISVDMNEMNDHRTGLREGRKESSFFHESILRKLVQAELKSEEELSQAGTFLPMYAVPNVVLFIQGFVKKQTTSEVEFGKAPIIIQDIFKQHFSELGHVLSFINYRKHMVMLIQVPTGYVSLTHWTEGEAKLLEVITVLQENFGIYLYIGVGSVYRQPIKLSDSYLEARKARRTPPTDKITLRYFEEITIDQQMNKCTKYISERCQDELTIKQVADHINFSVSYFCKRFKSETGRSFVEYVTFVRLQRAVWLLRNTDYTIEQIAEELGFNTPNYFSGTFKKYVGISPREYRATEEIIFD
ncbi:AraC family transcriptional regulator [Metabacillus herbersteinensis]|uniref:AraC family transcriptional regulator n=1 Tax=Metabacillus herbersteinensis TaxID=283816 RepID=A0ABV6GAP4_9BACI